MRKRMKRERSGGGEEGEKRGRGVREEDGTRTQSSTKVGSFEEILYVPITLLVTSVTMPSREERAGKSAECQ